jgi:hypothetical protein
MDLCSEPWQRFFWGEEKAISSLGENSRIYNIPFGFSNDLGLREGRLRWCASTPQIRDLSSFLGSPAKVNGRPSFIAIANGSFGFSHFAPLVKSVGRNQAAPIGESLPE